MRAAVENESVKYGKDLLRKTPYTRFTDADSLNGYCIVNKDKLKADLYTRIDEEIGKYGQVRTVVLQFKRINIPSCTATLDILIQFRLMQNLLLEMQEM